MNRKMTLVAATTAAFFTIAAPASAVLIASESFGYPAGGLNGRSGGTGWASTWTALSGAQVVSPGELQVSGNQNNLLSRPLTASVSAQDVYVSFLFQASAGTIGNNDFASFWFDNATAGDHSTVPGIGLKGNQATNTAANPDLFARVNLNATAYSEDLSGSRDTYFVVGHLWKSNPAGLYNHFDLWVNPDFDDLLAPEATSTAAGSLSGFSYVGLRTANLETDDRFRFDEFRLGTTWNDVVPVPEPASLLLLGSGLLGLAGVAKRRRK